MKLSAAQLKSVLHLNGLTSHSPSETITEVMKKAQYRADEYAEALMQLQKEEPEPSPLEMTVPVYRVDGSTPLPAPPEPIAPLPARAPVRTTTSRKWSPKSLFRGRMSVVDYWKALITTTGMNALLALLIVMAAAALHVTHVLGDATLATGYIATLILLILIPIVSVTTISFMVRRLHDLGYSGLWILALLALDILARLLSPHASVGANPPTSVAGSILALVSFILWLVIVCKPGKKELNAYGAPAQYRSAWAAIIGKQ